VNPAEWPLGYDAADGGTTASVGAVVDGRTLVYAGAGDSCALLGVPPAKRAAGGAPRTVELVPEHSPTNLHDFASRLHSTGVHVVYDHPDMFENQPANLIPVFERDASAPGGWVLSQPNLEKAEKLGARTPAWPLPHARISHASALRTPLYPPLASPPFGRLRAQDGARRSRDGGHDA
jgi:hypothetical protein